VRTKALKWSAKDKLIFNISADDKARFHKNYVISPNGCWEWTRSLTRGDYGRMSLQHTSVLAHRISVFLATGTLPEVVDHVCRNHKCVNPGHLDSVDNRTNVLRGIGITAQNARKVRCKEGHILSGDNLYLEPPGLRKCRACKTARYQVAKIKELAVAVVALCRKALKEDDSTLICQVDRRIAILFEALNSSTEEATLEKAAQTVKPDDFEKGSSEWCALWAVIQAIRALKPSADK
jgi:hypothetical protein